MNNISGLHSCKPGNEPVIGQVKTFVVEQKTGKSGKAYTKITSKGADQGGNPYKILSAKPTGHTDSYGNVSFNIEIEPASGATPVAASPSGSFQQRDTPRQYMMRSANLLEMSVKAAKSVFGKDYERELATSLFIQAARAGMIEQMPAKPMDNGSPETTEADPVQEADNDEPPF